MNNPWIQQYIGKTIEAYDPSNYAQCYDLASQFCIDHNVPLDDIMHLRAYEIYTLATDQTRQDFDLIPNTPEFVPQVLDMVVFGSGIGQNGHVSIATGDGDVNHFTSLDQNWNGHAYCEIVDHNYDWVLGVLRLKNLGGRS
jgi:hypothetical protein